MVGGDGTQNDAATARSWLARHQRRVGACLSVPVGCLLSFYDWDARGALVLDAVFQVVVAVIVAGWLLAGIEERRVLRGRPPTILTTCYEQLTRRLRSPSGRR